jgi:acyl dehydratase
MDSETLSGIVAALRRRVGTTTTPTTAEVEHGAIRKFTVATGDTDPLHWDEAYAKRTRHGGLVAPPTFVAAFVHGHIPEILVQDLPFQRMLHAEDVVTNHRLMRPGDVITAYARYADAFSKAGARGPTVYQVADLILDDATGTRVAEVRITAVSF